MAPTAKERDPEKGKPSQDRPPRKPATFDWELFKLIFSVTITCPLLWYFVLDAMHSPLDVCRVAFQRYDGNFCRSTVGNGTAIEVKADQGPVCQIWSDVESNSSYTAVQLEYAPLDDWWKDPGKGNILGTCSLKMFESADCSGESMVDILEVREAPSRPCYYPDSEDLNNARKIQSVSLECRTETQEPEPDRKSGEQEVNDEARLYL